ncbi:MAG: polysaccharide biosynthesis tyrosine autokinase [Acidobacteriota bacterium]
MYDRSQPALHPAAPPPGPAHQPPIAPVESEDPIDLSKYLGALRRRWLLLLACCLIAGAWALLRYTLTTKEYRATSVIQIERRRLSVVATGGQASWLEDWWNMEYYPTQYRLLRSRGMAERVLIDLRLYEDPLFAGTNTVNAGGDGSAEADAATIARFAGRLKGGLEVNPIKDTQLVELSYRSSNPELAARIANGYAEAFIEWGIETRTSTVGKASNFLAAQIDALREDVEAQQEQLATFEDADVALDPAGEALLDRREALEQQYNLVLADRISKQAAWSALSQRNDSDVANTASGGRAAELKSEIARLENEYQRNLDTFSEEWPAMIELRNKIDESRAELSSLESESADSARSQAAAAFRRAQREEGTLAEELRRVKNEITSLNSTALEYNNIKMSIETRQELLNELLKRQSETEVASRIQSGRESNVRVVDRAVVPGKPFKPQLRNDLVMALLFGFVAGAGGIVMLEYLDRTIKIPEDLEGITHLPTLTVIPDVDEKSRGYGLRLGKYGNQGYGYSYGGGYGYGGQGKAPKGGEGEKDIELLPHTNPRLAIAEAYRSLRTAILLSTAEKLQIVAVTSAEPGEGKTATATNLAVVMSQLNRRVLLIDGDLRRPRVHKIFDLKNHKGLVNFLTGTAGNDNLAMKTEVPNLFICPSGPIPPNPSELLASERMQEFLQAAKAKFDFVIIDTPPVLPVTDTLILGPLADGVVLCARAGVLVYDDAKATIERLRYAGIRMLGTVLNRYRRGPTRYRKRYYYYGVYEEDAPAATKSTAA